MDKNLQNISKVESFFNQLLDGKVSENTFFTNLPISIDDSMKDLVLVDISSSIRDMDAYGYGTVLVYLFVKPFSNGQKDVSRMSELEQLLQKAIEECSDEHYSLTRGSCYTDYDDTRNLHCNIYEIKTLIF